MRHLRTVTHPDIELKGLETSHTRFSTRALAISGQSVLMLFTERYNDYSFPGGGLDCGEDKVQGMIRELREETGAKNIQNIKEFGIYEEHRPWYKDDYDIQHMISYCYTCTVDDDLGTTSLEDYEIKNGMGPVWVNIDKAISHNLETIAHSKKKGMSVERETFLLQLIKKELFTS
ncbi:MAG: ADP-ribose pyrophosphatase YjhB (NUDIX family) [Bacteriovoracaceae bacterium]|jgi:ADP-ribose pyrophosphatase YjhB (NUDIX family)